MPGSAAADRLLAAQSLLATAQALPAYFGRRPYSGALHEAFPLEHRVPPDLTGLLRAIDWTKP